MKTIKHTLIAVLLAVLPLTLAGCSNASHPPEEWLNLSIAGLAGTDQYAFSGQTTIYTAEGFATAPRTFKGHIEEHTRLHAQGDDGEELEWSPIELLQKVKNANKKVSFNEAASSADTVALHVVLNDKDANKLWKEQLQQEMNKLAAKAPLEEGAYKTAWMKEFNDSRKQMDNMLKSLQVQSQYDVLIDRGSLVPLKLKEHTIFHYSLSGQDKQEKRDTNVSFDSFDGTGTVQ
ncbi:hypothetical protein M3194_03040 [Paenibacillus glycanilyticus]|uniref:hypothetical protein n=1 Tax=Paenibacillus glycanilyticus TaxID=126569 RepID=UPI00203FF226|nr:hypothetical protein [Paenibacillus glycanilyticus]MCM3626345.1 hypothetical protein [Paenibacillus glycanilyticus]